MIDFAHYATTSFIQVGGENLHFLNPFSMTDIPCIKSIPMPGLYAKVLSVFLTFIEHLSDSVNIEPLEWRLHDGSLM